LNDLGKEKYARELSNLKKKFISGKIFRIRGG
jgi:hypothetical protein